MRAVFWARYRSFLHNPKSFLLMLIMPIVFTAAFGYTNMEPVYEIPFVDLDHSAASAELIEELEQVEIFVIQLTTESEMKDIVARGQADVGFVIPKGYAEKLSEDTIAVIDIVKQKDSAFLYTVKTEVEQAAKQQVKREYGLSLMTEQLLAATTVPSQKIEDTVREAIERELEAEPAFIVKQDQVTKEADFLYNQQLQSSLGFTLFFVMFTVIFSVGEFVMDRENRVLDRLIVSPLRRWQIYSGNFLYSFSVGVLQVLLLITVWRYLFRFDWGSSWGLILAVMIPYVFVTTALGLLLTSFVTNFKQLNSIVPIIAVSSAMLGGAYWPIEIVTSNILLALAKVIPLTYAMEGMKSIALYDEGYTAILMPAATMMSMAILMALLSLYILERRFSDTV